MAYENGNPVRLLYLVNVLAVCTVEGGGDDSRDGGGVSTGVIVAVSIVGFLIALVTILLCFHQCCTKPKSTVKPQRISVIELVPPSRAVQSIGIGQNTVPPSRIVQTAPPMNKSTLIPVHPPPYSLYEDNYGTPMDPHIVHQPRDPFSRRQDYGIPMDPLIVHQPRDPFSRRQGPSLAVPTHFDRDPHSVIPYTRNFSENRPSTSSAPPPYKG